MRILDKYLLREFGLPVLFCFEGFLMLWVVMDLFSNLDDFLNAHARVSQVAHFYLLTFPGMLVEVLPVSLLLGLLWCLAQMGRHNELLAMRSSGISVWRIACPVWAVGLLASLAVLGINQQLVPRSRNQADIFMSTLKGKTAPGSLKRFFMTDIVHHREWYAGQLNPRQQEMNDLEIHEEKPDGSPLLDLYAERARWQNGAWHFFGVELHDHTRVPVAVTRASETNLPSIKTSLKDLALEGREPDQMTSKELKRYIGVLKRSGRKGNVAEFQVTLQYRYAFPLTCCMALWIGVPAGMRVGRRGPLLSVGLALGTFVSFYFLTHISLALGRGHHLPPTLAAWLTNGIFAVVGAVLMARQR